MSKTAIYKCYTIKLALMPPSPPPARGDKRFPNEHLLKSVVIKDQADYDQIDQHSEENDHIGEMSLFEGFHRLE